MSAFLLSDEEFQRIADWLYEKCVSKNSRYSYEIRSFIGLDNSKDEDYNASADKIRVQVCTVVRNFYNLNRLSLVTRYGERYDRSDEKQFLPKFDAFGSFKKTLSALRSLHYQCAEYIVCETTWLKELDIFIGKICEIFVSQSEQG